MSMKKKKIIFASIFGNMLEFYDFMLFVAFSVVIGQTFFPGEDASAALLKSLAVFGAGFVMRPFGAMLFGYIGDKFGRKQALTFSVLLMGIPTLTMGIMPSYTEVGIAAPIVIMVCRLLQGLCTGGEYNGAAIFALEHIGAKGAGITGGLICGSAGVGALAALGVSALVGLPMMPEWAWRGAFILGASGSVVGWYVRARMAESPVFQQLQKKDKIVTSNPLLQVLRRQKLAVITTLIMGVLDGLLSYFVFVFIPLFLKIKLGYSESLAFVFGFIGITGFTVGSPLMGALLDRFSAPTYFKVCLSVLIFLAIPSFLLFEMTSLWIIAGSVFLFSLMAASIAGAQHAYVQNLFAPQDRYSGIAFSFSTGMSIGGFTPFFFTVFMGKPNGLFYMGFYFLLWVSIALFAVLRLNNHQKGHLSTKIF